MGVYIKGMEMPKNCESCQFRRCISDLIMFGWVGCQLDVGMAKKESFKGRHPDCPLVEVKAPHGRLIDADALRARMYHEAFETDSDMQRWESGCWIRYKLFERTEEAAPTVLEAEGEG